MGGNNPEAPSWHPTEDAALSMRSQVSILLMAALLRGGPDTLADLPSALAPPAAVPRLCSR